MKHILLRSATLGALVGIPGCASLPSANREHGVRETNVVGTKGIGATLAQAGYLGTPMRREGNAVFVHATLDTTTFEAQLSSGAPYDLWLNDSLARRASSALHMTHMLSSYWTFSSSHGQWAYANRFTVGTIPLGAIEAKIERAPAAKVQASLGATLFMSRGAIMDYATDTLYVLGPTPAPVHPAVARQSSLRAVLESAGQYRTFLALMDRAGLSSFLDSAPPRAPVSKSDSIAWIGLRVNALQLSGVGAMPANDMHLHLTRQTVDQEIRGSLQRTAFVPTDAAFSRIPADTLRALQADTARLARLLRAHLYAGATIDTAAMRTLIRGAVRTGESGPAFGFQVFGSRIDVDRLDSWENGRVIARATIVQPELKTTHGVAVAHGIDRVLGMFEESPIAVELAQQGFVRIPLHRLEDGNGYFVSATINGAPMQLTLETGTAGEIILDKQLAAHAQLSPGSYSVTFDSVALGAVRVDTADFSGPMQSVIRQGYRPSVGVVGTTLLARYQARADYAAGMLYLRRPATH